MGKKLFIQSENELKTAGAAAVAAAVLIGKNDGGKNILTTCCNNFDKILMQVLEKKMILNDMSC